jgi:biopolymer transport protein ExbD
MAAGAPQGDDEPIVAINVTPLVDVVLVLLIIFMVTAAYIVKPAIEVDLPEAATAGEVVETTLSLIIASDGRLFLNGDPVDEATLAQRCRAASDKDPRVQAIIAADSDTRHGVVVRVIDVIKQHGVKSFAINVDRATPMPLAAPATPPAPAPE